MIFRPTFLLMLVGLASPSLAVAQIQVLSSSPPLVEYQYQLNYERPWRGWPGPGLSLGGSLPANSRQGISSLYGLPFPAPLGAGVYMNPFAYSARLPGVPGAPLHFGLSASTTPASSDPRATDRSVTPVSQTGSQVPVGNGIHDRGFPHAANVQPVAMSSPTSFQRSCEMDALGDEKMKLQNWTQAYINYRNATNHADDRADSHIRVAFASAALKRYPEAVHEFKRALSIDPHVGDPGESLESVLGPESRVIRATIINDIARWTREDLRNQDRLFLLGAMLHFDGDRRAREVLQAALEVTGSADHIVALLASVPLKRIPATQVPSIQPPPVESPEAAPPTPDSPEVNNVPVPDDGPMALRGN